jgi:hypothetical protein
MTPGAVSNQNLWYAHAWTVESTPSGSAPCSVPWSKALRLLVAPSGCAGRRTAPTDPPAAPLLPWIASDGAPTAQAYPALPEAVRSAPPHVLCARTDSGGLVSVR